MANVFDRELCNEKHERISDVLQEHNARLNDHESRLSEMEKCNVKMDEIVKQNMQQTQQIIQSNKELNETMVTAIDKLSDAVSDIKDKQQEFYVDSLNARKDLSDRINENQYKPSSDNWKLLIGAVITAIVGGLIALGFNLIGK